MNTAFWINQGVGRLADFVTTVRLGLASPNRVEGFYSPREEMGSALSCEVGAVLSRHLPATSAEGWFEFTPLTQERPFILRTLDQFRSIDLATAEPSMCSWSLKLASTQNAEASARKLADSLNHEVGNDTFSVSVGKEGVHLVAQVSPYEINAFKLCLAGSSIVAAQLLAEFRHDNPQQHSA